MEGRARSASAEFPLGIAYDNCVVVPLPHRRGDGVGWSRGGTVSKHGSARLNCSGQRGLSSIETRGERVQVNCCSVAGEVGPGAEESEQVEPKSKWQLVGAAWCWRWFLVVESGYDGTCLNSLTIALVTCLA